MVGQAVTEGFGGRGLAVDARALPVAVDRDEARRLVLARIPTADIVSATLLHHPYAGFLFDVVQSPIGARMEGKAYTMVDLCSGSTALCDPWPDLVGIPPEVKLAGPAPTVSEKGLDRQAQQYVIRALIHRRLSLHHPTVTLVARVAPLYKPNWLLAVRTDDNSFGVLVDALSGLYHTLRWRGEARATSSSEMTTHGARYGLDGG